MDWEDAIPRRRRSSQGSKVERTVAEGLDTQVAGVAERRGLSSRTIFLLKWRMVAGPSNE
jgi:hypothetical protein